MGSDHSSKYKKVGLRIAHYRNEMGLTQQQLSDIVGISKSYLSKIESPNTAKSFSLDVLFSLAEALEVSILELLEDSI